MTLNIARVELFNATSEDYEELHEAMEALGFVRKVKYSDGRTKQLPNGTYSSTKKFSDMAAIRDQIVSAGTPLSSKKPSVFVAEINRFAAHLYDS